MLHEIYRKYYNKMLAIPGLFFILFLLILYTKPISFGIDFKGGMLISFSGELKDPLSLKEEIKSITKSDVKITPLSNGGFIEISGKIGEREKKEIENILTSKGYRDIVAREVLPSLGKEFWETAKLIVISGIVLLSISVFIFFRKLTPAMIMVCSMLYDMMGMLAMMALFDIPLTLETMTILLLLVGYSIDTDVVLSTFLLKRKEGDAFARVSRAASTGMHMTGTTMISMALILLVGYTTRNINIIWIGAVMIFGLISDIIVTWFLNAPLLLKWVRKNA